MNEPFKIFLVWLFVVWAFASIWGFVIPELISSNSSIGVLIGFCVMAVSVYAAYMIATYCVIAKIPTSFREFGEAIFLSSPKKD